MFVTVIRNNTAMLKVVSLRYNWLSSIAHPDETRYNQTDSLNIVA